MDKACKALVKALSESTKEETKPIVEHLFVCNEVERSASPFRLFTIDFDEDSLIKFRRERIDFWTNVNRVLRLTSDTLKTLSIFDYNSDKDGLLELRRPRPYGEQSRFMTSLEAIVDIETFPLLTSLAIGSTENVSRQAIIRRDFPGWNRPSFPSLKKLHLCPPCFKNLSILTVHPILVGIHSQCKELSQIMFTDFSGVLDHPDTLMKLICGGGLNSWNDWNDWSDWNNWIDRNVWDGDAHTRGVDLIRDCLSRHVLPHNLASVKIRVSSRYFRRHRTTSAWLELEAFQGLTVDFLDEGPECAPEAMLSDWRCDVF